MNKWEEFYNNTPLDKIPWQKTQYDFLTEVIESGKIKPGLVLDLGCGTGMKSIYLAKKGFKVTGVDISETAIKYAQKNKEKENIDAEFFIGDVLDLSFLEDKKYDFILDWACFHCIPKERRKDYVFELLKHSKNNAKLLLRCFSETENKKGVVKNSAPNVYLSSEQDIKSLFKDHFKILEINKSKPNSGNPPSDLLSEYLMEKKK
ncbi:MAG: class I SAM-dependent methyltransferase [Promethearchaeota archaeon]